MTAPAGTGSSPVLARPPTSTEQATHGLDSGDVLGIDARRGAGARPVADEHRLRGALRTFAALHDRLS